MYSIFLKKHIPPYLLFILLAFLTSSSNAQKGYEKGYIVKNNNDTIHGKLKDRKAGNYQKLYKKVRFKKNGLFPKKYNPSKIQAYTINDSHFESKWMKQSGGLFNERYTSIEGKGNKVFLKVVAEGNLSLYHLEYIDLESSYIDYIPLFKKKNETYYIRVTQGLFGLKRKALSNYFSENEELIRLINEKKLTSPIEIVEYYNENY